MPDSHITKRALAAAMKDLMQTQPFMKINVQDICAACGMNRKSFYYHFRDKYELVNWIYYTEFVEALSSKEHRDSWAFLTDMCVYFYQNRIFYVNALKVTGQNSFREYFGQVFRPIVEQSVAESLEDSENRNFYAVFFTDAFLLAIERWLCEQSKMPPEAFIRLLRQCIEGTARRVMQMAGEDAAGMG